MKQRSEAKQKKIYDKICEKPNYGLTRIYLEKRFLIFLRSDLVAFS